MFNKYYTDPNEDKEKGQTVTEVIRIGKEISLERLNVSIEKNIKDQNDKKEKKDK